MFLRLRHPAVVGGHDEQREIDRAQSGDHVANEIFVSGHIDHAHGKTGQREMREAEIDRDTARLFLGQTIGVDAGQRLDQRGLPVIDVTGGRENEMFLRHGAFVRQERKAAAITSSCAGKIVRRSSRNLPWAI